MSKSSGHLYHPINNYPEPIYTGFSWPNLFFNFIWFLYKGMWAWALICLFLATFTFGFSNLIFPFFANQLHQKYLLKAGYLGHPINAVDQD
tara:strand:+ start:1614 stop:1886 length:273 start_codon:yes stop_codon:yes gene_type:complete